MYHTCCLENVVVTNPNPSGSCALVCQEKYEVRVPLYLRLEGQTRVAGVHSLAACLLAYACRPFITKVSDQIFFLFHLILTMVSFALNIQRLPMEKKRNAELLCRMIRREMRKNNKKI